ncbi:MAG: SUMF1/EgtB/PvdO family nonheme iron enzyme [Phycisphaerales bacterium]
MHEVFLSHSSRDKTAADAVCHALEEAGTRCWVAPRDVQPGVPYASSILDAIEGCALMVVMVSKDANDSEHVAREVELGARHRRPLLPIRIDSVEPSRELTFFLGRAHWLDAMSPPFAAHLALIVKSVQGIVPRESAAARSASGPVAPVSASARAAPPPPSGPTPPRPRARLWAVGGVLLLAVVALVAFAVVKSRPPKGPGETGLPVAAAVKLTLADVAPLKINTTQKRDVVNLAKSPPDALRPLIDEMEREWKTAELYFSRDAFAEAKGAYERADAAAERVLKGVADHAAKNAREGAVAAMTPLEPDKADPAVVPGLSEAKQRLAEGDALRSAKPAEAAGQYAKAEESAKAATTALAEARKKALEERQAEEARKAAEALKAEEARKAAEAKKAEDDGKAARAREAATTAISVLAGDKAEPGAAAALAEANRQLGLGDDERKAAPLKAAGLYRLAEVAALNGAAVVSEARKAEEARNRKTGDTITNSIGAVMVFISPGTFTMGTPATEADRGADETQHQVTLTRGFYLGKTEVTQAQWRAVMGNDPSNFKGDTLPVEKVSWDDCAEFCRKLSAKEGKKYRLPTEAEWEYACRAGTTTPFSFGATITPQQVNFDGNFTYGGSAKGLDRQKTVAAGSLPANPWGLHEMHGNVWEWCSDWYGESPARGATNPTGPEQGEHRVLRGGSWTDDPHYCRAGDRGRIAPDYRNTGIGLRLALDSE